MVDGMRNQKGLAHTNRARQEQFERDEHPVPNDPSHSMINMVTRRDDPDYSSRPLPPAPALKGHRFGEYVLNVELYDSETVTGRAGTAHSYSGYRNMNHGEYVVNEELYSLEEPTGRRADGTESPQKSSEARLEKHRSHCRFKASDIRGNRYGKYVENTELYSFEAATGRDGEARPRSKFFNTFPPRANSIEWNNHSRSEAQSLADCRTRDVGEYVQNVELTGSPDLTEDEYEEILFVPDDGGSVSNAIVFHVDTEGLHMTNDNVTE